MVSAQVLSVLNGKTWADEDIKVIYLFFFVMEMTKEELWRAPSLSSVSASIFFCVKLSFCQDRLGSMDY